MSDKKLDIITTILTAVSTAAVGYVKIKEYVRDLPKYPESKTIKEFELTTTLDAKSPADYLKKVETMISAGKSPWKNYYNFTFAFDFDEDRELSISQQQYNDKYIKELEAMKNEMEKAVVKGEARTLVFRKQDLGKLIQATGNINLGVKNIETRIKNIEGDVKEAAKVEGSRYVKDKQYINALNRYITLQLQGYLQVMKDTEKLFKAWIAEAKESEKE